jgi:DNA-binding response OmpR family regulator
MQALVISHQPEEADLLEHLLRRAGITAHSSYSIEEAIEAWSDDPSDFILVSAFENHEGLNQQIHLLRANTIVPVIVLTDPLSEERLISCYDAGADLVVFKPYSMRVIQRQIQALLRRSNSIPMMGLPVLVVGMLELDPETRTVKAGASVKHLTQLEFRLLHTLLTHAGQILSSERLVEHVWGFSGEGNRDLVRGLVQRLRVKIEPDPHNPQFILTEPGIGYYFSRPTEEDLR